MEAIVVPLLSSVIHFLGLTDFLINITKKLSGIYTLFHPEFSVGQFKRKLKLFPEDVLDSYKVINSVNYYSLITLKRDD